MSLSTAFGKVEGVKAFQHSRRHFPVLTSMQQCGLNNSLVDRTPHFTVEASHLSSAASVCGKHGLPLQAYVRLLPALTVAER